VSATFFVVGRHAENAPDMIRLQHEKGHLVVTHTYSHDYASVYASADAFMSEIEKTEQILTSILGFAPARIVRFPAGSTASQLTSNPALRDAIKSSLAQNGWRYFDWNASMGDSISGWVPEPGYLADALNKQIDEKIAVGATDIVVLAHDVDAKPWTPTDLPLVIKHCQDKGYVFKTLTLDTVAVEF
jgi:peptidoglycan/xylan/chitin deacetylase (PgdA/CDA1 family)